MAAELEPEFSPVGTRRPLSPGGGMTGVSGAGGWKGENQRHVKGRPNTLARASRLEMRGRAAPLPRFKLSTAYNAHK